MTRENGYIKFHIGISVPQRPIVRQRAINRGFKKVWTKRNHWIGRKFMPLECNTEEKLAQWLYKECWGEGTYVGCGYQRRKDYDGVRRIHLTKKKFKIDVWRRGATIDHHVIYIRGMYHYFNWKKRNTDKRAMKMEDKPLPSNDYGFEYPREI